jgi:signal transduction histidine kinase
MMISRLRLDLRFLLGAFLAVAATFFAASALSQHAMARIDVASDEIAFGSAPRIQRLAGLRSAVRHAEYLVGIAVTIGGTDSRPTVAAAMAELGAETSAYLALASVPGESGLPRELDESIAAFQAAVRRTLEGLDGGRPEAAHVGLGEVEAAADRVSEAAAGEMEHDAQLGRARALQIKAVRRNANLIAWAANASCLLFTALAAFLVRRQLRRYGALVEEHSMLQEARAVELENFAGRAAHDILNPVSATQMSLDMAARLEKQDAHTKDLVERAQRTLLRVRLIVDGLLRFAQAGAGAEPGVSAGVRGVIEDVASGIRPAREGGRVEVRVEEVCDCRAQCSEGVLTSMVMNLAHNAVKYTADAVERPHVILRANRRGRQVHVEVEDNGPGIPSDALEEIFLPFVRGPTLGKEGLGLGLATVKRLCESHGGSVGVRSTLGSGSTFWFELPLAEERVATAAAAGQGVPPRGAHPSEAHSARAR